MLSMNLSNCYLIVHMLMCVTVERESSSDAKQVD
jgi:hypothetical protein